MNPALEWGGLRLFDAHLHLQDPRLQQVSADANLNRAGNDFVKPCDPDVQTGRIINQVSNGTHPGDWPLLERLGGERVLKAYGVHPWRVDSLAEDWESVLRGYLCSGAVSVGEIGLDRWIEPRNEELQLEVFNRQLALAAELELPPTLHCLRAWGMLIDCLRNTSMPRGFLVHGFGGSRETLYRLLDLGGYVSFSAYAADPCRHRMREAARACPADRLLVETDAPDMVPPEDVCMYSVTDTEGRIHHPAEIRTAYMFLAGLRGVEVNQFAGQVEKNFGELFLNRQQPREEGIS